MSDIKPLLVPALLMPFAAAAQPEELRVPETVVTATRTPQPAEESLSPTTVIDSEEIEESQADNFRELLQGRAGLQLNNQGGEGKATSLFLRGTNSDHVKVLVDGVEIGSATTGQAPFQFLPLSQIERVEIVRIPRSSIYGGDAVGGVVQVFTKRGQGPPRGTAMVSRGSDRTWKADAGVSGSAGDFHYAVSGGFFQTDGFDARTDIEPDDDGFINRSASLRVGYDPSRRFGVELHLLRSDADTEFDGSFVNKTESVKQVIGLDMEGRPLDFWRTEVKVNQSRDDEENFLNGQFRSRFETVKDNVIWQNDFQVASGQLVTAGFDYQLDSVDSTTNFAEDERWNWAVFLQHQAEVGRHSLNVSYRHDENEAFGSSDTGSVAYGFRIDDTWRVSASWGRAFKEPTFNDLFFPAGGFFRGNPNLDPEKSWTVDAGVTADPDWGRFEARAFHTEIEDLIVNQFVGFTLVPNNVDKAEINGLELVARSSPGRWRLGADLTIQDPVDEANGNLLPRRSRVHGQVSVERRMGPARLGVEAIGRSESFDDSANNTRLGGFGLVNLTAGVRIAEDWRIRGRIENLLDKDYQTAENFRTQGRFGSVTVAYGPGGR